VPGGVPAVTAAAVIDRLIVPLQGGWRVAVALGFIWTVHGLAAGDLAPSWGGVHRHRPGAGLQLPGDRRPRGHLPDGFAADRLGFTLAELVPLAAVLAAAAPAGPPRPRPGGARPRGEATR